MNKENPKYFYSFAKSKSYVRQNINMLYNCNNDIVTNTKGMSDILQNKFISVFSDPNDSHIIFSLLHEANPPLNPSFDSTPYLTV